VRGTQELEPRSRILTLMALVLSAYLILLGRLTYWQVWRHSDMTRLAAERVYEHTGLGPENVDVIELHDCFSANEMITYEALGLCPEGTAHTLVDQDAFTYGGKVVVNPSGGLISKGHPLGATGTRLMTTLLYELERTGYRRRVN